MERLDRSDPSGGRRKRRKEVVHVTQLIGAICGERKTVVAVADRMVTGFNYEYEPWVSKAYWLTDHVFLMMAGPLEAGYGIAQRAAWQVSQKGLTGVGQIADEVGIVFQAERNRQVIARYLSKFGIYSLDRWLEVQLKLREELASDLRTQITRHRVRVELMVLGVDAHGGQIYAIGDGAEVTPCTRAGYCCMGSGMEHADTTFARYQYDTSFSKEEALYVAYEAKRMAEMAPGVGPETDIFIMDASGMSGLHVESIAELKRKYDRRPDRQPRKRAQRTIAGWEYTTYPIRQATTSDTDATEPTEGQSP